jgi:hypothetical protein
MPWRRAGGLPQPDWQSTHTAPLLTLEVCPVGRLFAEAEIVVWRMGQGLEFFPTVATVCPKTNVR